jgi:hypothetical protein
VGAPHSGRPAGSVALLLPAVARYRLAEVTGPVEQPDPNDRDPEVGRALEVIAGQDAEAARILRKCCRDPELWREVGDRAGGLALERLVPARLAQVGAQLITKRVGSPDETLVGGELGQPRRRDLAKQADGILALLVPGLRRDVAEQFERWLMPRPTQVGRQLIES